VATITLTREQAQQLQPILDIQTNGFAGSI
jgi:hypothetical protein